MEIFKVSSESSRSIKERLKNYEVREPDDNEKAILNKSAYYLNKYRQKYGKKEIPDEHIKLTIVRGTDDLSELGGEINRYGGKTGGFNDNGELYISDEYDWIEIAHIMTHEMTHQYTGEYSLNYFNRDGMEAATELVAIEILAKVINEVFGDIEYTDENGDKILVTGEKEILMFLQTYYQTYSEQIEDLQKEDFDFEEIKQNLFSGKDYVSWGYKN